MDEVVQVDAWEWSCINALAGVAFVVAVAYVCWWLYSELREGG
jgi:hypothetical protein